MKENPPAVPEFDKVIFLYKFVNTSYNRLIFEFLSSSYFLGY